VRITCFLLPVPMTVPQAPVVGVRSWPMTPSL
jgi:hypothetical protein